MRLTFEDTRWQNLHMRVKGKKIPTEKNRVKKQFYSERELEDLGLASVRSLQQWRLRRLGPPYIKCGHSVRYRFADVEAWLASRTVVPTPWIV